MKLQSKYYQKVLETIANLHPHTREAEMITKSIGMQPAHLQLNGTGMVIWDSALSLAEKEGKVKELLQSSARIYPGNTALKELISELDNESVFIKSISWDEYIKPPSAGTVKLFLVYDPDNSSQVNPLKSHLKILQRTGKIALLDMHTGIEGGQDKEQAWLHNTGDADVLLLMITASFLASDDCMQLAFTGFDMRKRVVPVLLAPCLWSRIELLENIVPLPPNGLPVSKWPDKDEAFFEIAKGVESLAAALQKGKTQ